jgi:DNA adenine methylase
MTSRLLCRVTELIDREVFVLDGSWSGTGGAQYSINFVMRKSFVVRVSSYEIARLNVKLTQPSAEIQQSKVIEIGAEHLYDAHMIDRVINVSAVPHRSPFRYPGGKTWLVPYVRQWLRSLEEKPVEFVEAFAGGGIAGLSALFDGLASRLTLIELDEQIAAVWTAILANGQELAARILEFDLTREKVVAELASAPTNAHDRAFQTILRNRVQRGGIMAPGAGLLRAGENGHGIASRWYPETLSRRILDIVNRREAITFVEGDGIGFIKRHADLNDRVWFIDPPYTLAGRRLYTHSEIDHRQLFDAVTKLKGDFLMTYDNARPIQELADEFGFDTHPIPMKNTHHSLVYELLIGRNLAWARRPLQLVENPLFKNLKAGGNASC